MHIFSLFELKRMNFPFTICAPPMGICIIVLAEDHLDRILHKTEYPVSFDVLSVGKSRIFVSSMVR